MDYFTNILAAQLIDGVKSEKRLTAQVKAAAHAAALRRTSPLVGCDGLIPPFTLSSFPLGTILRNLEANDFKVETIGLTRVNFPLLKGDGSVKGPGFLATKQYYILDYPEPYYLYLTIVDLGLQDCWVATGRRKAVFH